MTASSSQYQDVNPTPAAATALLAQVTADEAAAAASATAAAASAAAAAATMAGALVKANNLSDVASATTARSNLGLAAVAASGSATDLTTGTLPAARLPNPSVGALGGVKSKASTTHQFLTQIGTDGSVSAAQPAFSDISGSVAASQLPNPAVATLGGVMSKASASHQFLTQIGTDGSVSQAQPAFSDISGTATGAQLVAVGDIRPGGRLTLATGTPVMTTTVSGATTVYYTPYVGDLVPIWNGSAFVPTVFTELSQATTDSTKSPAAVGASLVYDVFVWSDSGTLRATRGPAWSSSVLRGTGAGTTELQRVNGILVNKNAITNGPAAGYGTYVGTIASNGSSTIDWIIGTAASGGGAAFFFVWNYYNRVMNTTLVADSGTSYTYSSATIRSARASNSNRVTWVSGMAEDAGMASSTARVDTVATAVAYVQTGFALDATNVMGYGTLTVAPTANVFTANPVAYGPIGPLLGIHYVQAVEAGDGTHSNTINFTTSQLLSFSLRM